MLCNRCVDVCPEHCLKLVPLEPDRRYVWLEDVIAVNLPQLFPGCQVLATAPFRIARDADVTNMTIHMGEFADGSFCPRNREGATIIVYRLDRELNETRR